MSEQHGYQLDLADVNGPLYRASCSCEAWSHPSLVDLARSGTARAAQAAYTLHVLDAGTIRTEPR